MEKMASGFIAQAPNLSNNLGGGEGRRGEEEGREGERRGEEEREEEGRETRWDQCHPQHVRALAHTLLPGQCPHDSEDMGPPGQATISVTPLGSLPAACRELHRQGIATSAQRDMVPGQGPSVTHTSASRLIYSPVRRESAPHQHL